MIIKLLIVYSLVSYVIAILAIAFFTLLERKILGYAQLRKGPNKVSFIGILQPFADAAKLFTKEIVLLKKRNLVLFILAPAGRLFFNLILWRLFPFLSQPSFNKFSILMFICVSRIRVYFIIIAGWASNSKYALLGRMRSLAQIISYEVRIIFIIITVSLLASSFSFVEIRKVRVIASFIFFPLLIPWIISILAETNRAPFDLPEGEAELVSGFNVEYRAGLFALIFIAEYSNVLIIRVFTAVLFFSPLNLIVVSLILASTTLVVRATLPIIRYDQLMYMAWKCFLPLSISFLVYSIFFICLTTNFKLQTLNLYFYKVRLLLFV